MKKLSPKLSIMKKISLALIAAVLQVLFLSNAKAGIVEDVIKEKKINISKAEERCRLSDELSKKVTFPFPSKEKQPDFDYFRICDGERYDVIKGRVIVGSDGRNKKTLHRADCVGMDERYLFIFLSPSKEILSVSSGFDGKYVIPADFDFYNLDYSVDELRKIKEIPSAFERADKVGMNSPPIELRKTSYTADELKKENERIRQNNKLNNRNEELKKINEKIEYFNKSEKSAIITSQKPIEKISYYHIKNCNIDFEQKINHNQINQQLKR